MAKADSFDYYGCLHRVDNLEDCFVYPIRLYEVLPQIAVPLLPDDPAVPIDLQVVFNRCYDTGSSPRRVRYNEDTPVPLLTEQQAKWTAGLLGQR